MMGNAGRTHELRVGESIGSVNDIPASNAQKRCAGVLARVKKGPSLQVPTDLGLFASGGVEEENDSALSPAGSKSFIDDESESRL